MVKQCKLLCKWTYMQCSPHYHHPYSRSVWGANQCMNAAVCGTILHHTHSSSPILPPPCWTNSPFDSLWKKSILPVILCLLRFTLSQTSVVKGIPDLDFLTQSNPIHSGDDIRDIVENSEWKEQSKLVYYFSKQGFVKVYAWICCKMLKNLFTQNPLYLTTALLVKTIKYKEIRDAALGICWANSKYAMHFSKLGQIKSSKTWVDPTRESETWVPKNIKRGSNCFLPSYQ